MSTAYRWIRVAACVGFLGVAMGAFGAHGLRSALGERARGEPDLEQSREYPAERRMAVFETGVAYHLVHGLAILGTAVLMAQEPRGARKLKRACWAFLVGIVIFSGSLYALGMTGMRWLGAITPLGGIAFLGGWVLLLLAVRAGSAEGERAGG